MNPTAEILLDFLGDLLYTPDQARLDVESLAPDFRDLGRGLLVFQETLAELRAFAAALGRGNLAAEPPRKNELAAPLKSLHANLRHLTWQSQQVAKGDYRQKVQFLGEFADAFNAMTRQLDERQRSLMAEIESGRQKTLALEQSVNLFTALMELAPQWIIALERDTRKALFTNQAADDALAADSVLSTRLRDWMSDYVDGQENMSPCTDTIEIATAQKTWFLSVAIHPFVWPPHRAIAFIISDRSEERERFRELESVAYRDPLTRVGSRHFGMKTLRDWIEARAHFCICFVDIDYLKYVNDTFGHPAGDDYIVRVAKMLSGFSRDVFVSRLGGDEFMLLQRDWSEERAVERLRELREELATQETPDETFKRSISYGVVEVPSGNVIPGSDLLSMADEKMYRFKRAHKRHRTMIRKGSRRE